MLDDIIELHRAGRLSEAEAGYRELLSANPGDAEVLHLLGIVRAQAGDREEGLRLVQRAIELDPQRDVFQHTLGEMHLHAGRLDESQAAYERAGELNPNLTTAHSGLGQIAFLRGDLDNAEHHFRIALRADEDDAQSLAGLGNIYLSRDEPKRASSYLSRAAELAPNDALIQGSLANAMLAMNAPDFALQAAHNALALKSDYGLARQVVANALLLKGDAPGARAAFEALLAEDGSAAAAHLGLGDIARLQQRHEDAIASYEQALRRQPEMHPAAIRRADALARSGRIDEAIAGLRERVWQYPQAAYVKVALARLLDQLRQQGEALPLWREAAALLPGNATVQGNLALSLDRNGEYEPAYRLAQKLAETRPALALLRARGALEAGDAREALQAVRAVADAQWQQSPQMARRRWRLSGLAHDALGLWREAVEDFQRAFAQDAPALPELPELTAPLMALIRERAAEPVLLESRLEAPILLAGLPGSRGSRLAGLLGEQPEIAVRRDRFSGEPDLLSAPFEEKLLYQLSQSDLSLLQHRYARPLRRSNLPEGARVIDWLPYLDARVLPALKRALPGVRIIQVQCDPRDALLNWLAFGANAKLLMRDPVEAARWLETELAHQALALELLPSRRIDAEAVLADPQGAQGNALAEFLGLQSLQPGPLTRAAEKNRRGMPMAFEAGHARHYRDALADAFAALA